MASDPQGGSTKNLSDSRAEGKAHDIPCPYYVPDSDSALQALLSSLTPGSADALSKEDVSKLSEKFKELLGGADLPEVCVYQYVCYIDDLKCHFSPP
jgi:hypothetical protein